MKKRTPKISTALRALLIAKLESSGLSYDVGQQLGIYGVERDHIQRTLHKSFQPLHSMVIPYYDLHGEPFEDIPRGGQFYRVRYLESSTEFSAQAKQPRYTQQPHTLPVAYYPKIVEWSKIADNVDAPLVITEGELKAAKACVEGFPTIGLGGVYNWRSAKIGVELIPSLEVVKWVRRNVYIAFDSDLATNTLVQTALRELSDELQRRGAFTHVVLLPAIESLKKVGLDDFFVFTGASAKQQFTQLLHDAEPLGTTRVLFSYNDRYTYIRNPGVIIDRMTGQKIAPAPFKEHLESTRQYHERIIRPDGSMVHKAISAASAWLRWPLRRYAENLTYAPGQERDICGQSGTMYNIWPGWGVQPKRGDVSLFTSLVSHIFTGAEDAAVKWFYQWCAYPLQFPGVKLFSSVVLHGVRHGTGKSLVGYTLGNIYGRNFTEIRQNDLHSNFNEWAEAKQLVMGDDVTGSNKRQEGDVLKKMITQKELRVNAKYMPSYVVPDYINYFFTSNHPDAFFLEDDDRRFFIHEVAVEPLPEKFYVQYGAWLKAGGASAVFAYLLSVDLSTFNPAAPAFKTAAKERMIADGQSDLGAWVRALKAAPDYMLKVGDVVLRSDLYTSKELLALYDPINRTGTTANGLGRELRRASIQYVQNGAPIRLENGSQNRYYAVRNPQKWATASLAQIVEHLKESESAKHTKY